jgi:hypothetical protein
MPALSRRPAGVQGGLADLFNWLIRARDGYFAMPPLKFEASTLGISVLFGLLVMPALIYLAGSTILQAYANGGLLALYFDFGKGLIDLRPSCWIVLLGPFGFLTLFRVFRFLLRKI